MGRAGAHEDVILLDLGNVVHERDALGLRPGGIARARELARVGFVGNVWASGERVGELAID